MPTHNHSTYVSTEGLHTHKINASMAKGSFAFTHASVWGEGTADKYCTGPFSMGRRFTTNHSWGSQMTQELCQINFDGSKMVPPATESTGKHTHSVTVHSTGASNAHNNMPPYAVVNFWQRVA